MILPKAGVGVTWMNYSSTWERTRHRRTDQSHGIIRPVSCPIPRSNRFARLILMKLAVPSAKGESSESNQHRRGTTEVWRQRNESGNEAGGARHSSIRHRTIQAFL